MAKRTIPTPAQLRQLLRYEPETGQLFWRERTPDTVNCKRESTRVRICKNWNARYAGKEVLQTASIRGHAYISVMCVKCLTHRVAWAVYHGEWPRFEIDHINGDQTDNRLENLRDVPHMENMRNCQMDHRNSTGQTGVWWDKSRGVFQAYITERRSRIALGRFKTIEEAVAARKAAELVLGFHRNHGRSSAA